MGRQVAGVLKITMSLTILPSRTVKWLVRMSSSGGDVLGDGDLSYAALGSYATRHEISVDGPLREYYLRGAGDTADEAEWRTEIGWPIFRADRPGAPRGAGR
jgi:hypothetical protein